MLIFYKKEENMAFVMHKGILIDEKLKDEIDEEEKSEREWRRKMEERDERLIEKGRRGIAALKLDMTGRL